MNIGVTIDMELKPRFTSLYGSMSKRLGIKKAPQIILTQSISNANKPFGKTAYYDPQKKLVKVYITKRHPTDILRSFAHELIHHWQNEHDALPPQQTGQEHYAQKDPVLRQREMEAYLLGNILFRDWQDENRYGAINENIEMNNKETIRAIIRKILFEFVKPRVISNKTITKSELRKLIKERIEEMGKKKNSVAKKGNPSPNQNYSQWLQQMFTHSDTQNKKAQKYYAIGFGGDYYCWYWDTTTQQVVTAHGGSHAKTFGNKIPYMTFRGRYDVNTKELSMTIPEYGKMKITKDPRRDAPPELLAALKKTFPGHKLFYFPFTV